MINKKIILTIKQKKFLAWVYVYHKGIHKKGLWADMMKRIINNDYYKESDVDWLNALREHTSEKYRGREKY
jgi:hypothetical protein